MKQTRRRFSRKCTLEAVRQLEYSPTPFYHRRWGADSFTGVLGSGIRHRIVRL